MDPAWLKAHVRDVLDYPKPGIVFKDITPLLGAADAFRAAAEWSCQYCRGAGT